MIEEQNNKPILLTGAQPTGMFHLGNYLGAVKNWCRLQYDYTCLFFIPNMHAITCPPYMPSVLRQHTLDMTAQYIACGLDPKSTSIFIQSSVIGHSELAWALACITPVGQLTRMTQYKAKSDAKSFVGSGLLYYPILMAADILLYNTKLVPVGEDQKQHLELARDLAIKFNQTYSETFNVPEPYILKEGSRVYSLQDPHKKMSKSDPNKKGTILIFESIDSIRQKVRSAVTDSGSGITYDPENKPGISNLIDILAALTEHNTADIEAQYQSMNYGSFKDVVAETLIEHLKPIQARYLAIREDKELLKNVLCQGQETAQKLANRVLSKVYRKVGFLDPRAL